jgi:HAE1 family hydrophobic/amphiphilic exporter-1
MNVIRQSGANVIDVMADVRERLDSVRTDLLPKLDPVAGPDLRMRQVYDETTYIDSAINLVVENLRQGSILSILLLLFFLRSVRYTLIISLTIPVCLIGTFLVLLAAGRTLNVISLAGLAFATGVVVDNAVVVLENIARRRQLGDAGLVAVYRGTKEVWAAILGGTLVSIAVMIPILTIQEEAGQLFFDLTLALAVSTGLSLIMAITVVPSAMAVLARLADARAAKRTPRPPKRFSWKNAWGLDGVFGRFNAALARGVYWLNTGWRGWTVRPALILLMCAASLLGVKYLAPPLDYLPAGNQNLVFGGLLVPPGLSFTGDSTWISRRKRPCPRSMQ